MYEFHTVQSNRNYSEKPQDSNNKNIRINGFVTVSPQVFIIENRIKATGPSVSCNTPFCRGETWRQGLAWAGSGWTVTKFPVPSSRDCSQEAPCGFGMLSKDVKAKTTGAKSTGHYILYPVSSTACTVTVSAKSPASPNCVTRRLQKQPHRDGNTGQHPVLSPGVPQEDLVLKQNAKFSFKPLHLCTGT